MNRISGRKVKFEKEIQNFGTKVPKTIFPNRVKSSKIDSQIKVKFPKTVKSPKVTDSPKKNEASLA